MIEDGIGGGFSIGEVARAVGLAPETLRLWEREGLVAPRRSGSGYRLYGEPDVERLREIKHLRRVEGLNFAAIRKHLGPPEVPEEAAAQNGRGGPERALGDRLRRLRVRSHETLKDVAEATGLSISFVSALERGDSGASVATLKLLAGHYGVTVQEVFGAGLPEEGSPLVKNGERPVMRWESGVRFEIMAPGTEKAMDPHVLHVPPHTGSEGFYSHDGEEFMHVTRGVLFVELKDRGTFRLEPGDTLYFPSTTPHRWWAEEEPAEAIAVNTPPTF